MSTASNGGKRMLKGASLFALICFLGSAPLYSRTLGQIAVGVLIALGVLMTLPVHRTPKGVTRHERH